ncbi:MAG: universal stress protein [Planctomycetota bacterium]
MSLEKIVVPLDGSELSDRIVAQLERILRRKDSSVTLARVLPAEARLPGGEALVDAAQVHLDGVARALRARGATVATEVLVGEPADRIVAFAQERGASLIAMATHGRTGLARWFRGSTAERVLRASPVPVLVANPFGLGERDERRFGRILVPLDLSERSTEILPLVREVATLYESEVFLLHAIEVPAPLEYPVSFEHLTGADATKMLAEQAKKLPGLRVSTATEVGAAAWSIVQTIEREKIDLVAMTTHGRSGVARWAYGSVAEQVIRHAACPLLVKRTAGEGD